MASDVEDNSKKIVRQQRPCQRKGMSHVVDVAPMQAGVQAESQEEPVGVKWESRRWLFKGCQ